jgi:hypothetical protein
MRIEILAVYVVLSGSVAMTSCSVWPSDEPGAVNSASWPSCSWPAALDPDESGSARDHCVAKRTRLSCALPGGVTEICPTNDPTRCEDEMPSGAQECHAECVRNAFSLVCGGAGPGPVPAPPAGCQPSLPVPGGVVFYCCPCGA